MRSIVLAAMVAGVLVAAGAALAEDMGQIVSAETRTGSVSSPTELDTFTFAGEPGRSVVIDLSTESGFLVPEVRLYDPTGTQVASAWGNPHAEIDAYELFQSGTYTIVAKDYNGTATGDYSLSLLVIPGATTSAQDPDGGQVQSAETRTGTILLDADTDAFTFDAPAGGRVVVDLSTESGFLVPEARLYDPTGTQVASAWGNPHAEIDAYELLQSGTYTIVAKDYNGTATGTYSLSLLVIPGPTLSPSDTDGGRIASGDTKAGSISALADTDAYALAGQAGNTVLITMTTESGFLVPELRLYDPSGAEETSAWGNPSAQISNHALAQTGLYTVVAKDYSGTATGTYQLSLTKIPPTVVLSCSANAVPSGTTVTFTASVSGGSGPYTWQWWFGDGELSSAQNTTHVYPESTTYAWYLIVRDAGGNGCVQDGFVDALGEAIFADGFESGDASAWSAEVP